MPVTLDDLLAAPNGAQFYNADLHVHTYGGSSDVTDSQMTVEAIVNSAVTEGISILAITDHNNDANILPALDLSESYADRLLVVPGVEISTAHGHLLVYFSPEKANCVRDLLGRIGIVGGYGSRDSHTTQSMADVILEAERLGGICVAAHIDREKTGFESLVSGYPSWKKDVLCAAGLCGLEFDSPNNLQWYSPEDDQTASGAERMKLLQAREASSRTAAKVQLAHIQNSDAHSIEDFVQRSPNRALTKFKMDDLTFQALRTALMDSEARVRAIASVPPTFPRILGMHLEGGFLDGELYHFSDNLNRFVGGRGAGKSTAVRSLAHGVGARDEFETHGNCPDKVTIYCEDANGVQYKYERVRGSEVSVHAKEDNTLKEVPTDAFRIEFYAQGEISEVAKDPLGKPALLQEFLDTHILLTDLLEREATLREELRQNSAQLIPLEAGAANSRIKAAQLAALNKQLAAAETGKVKEIATFQIRLAAEKALCDSLSDVKQLYSDGLTFSNFARDFESLRKSSGQLTGNKKCQPFLDKAKDALAAANALLADDERALNARLKAKAEDLQEAIDGIRAQHSDFELKIADKLAELRKQGLSGGIDQLNQLISQKTRLSAEVIRIENQRPQLNRVRARREELLATLQVTRQAIMQRRKDQVATINANLKKTIRDYAINLFYAPSGIIDEFKELVLRVMHGTYFQEDTADEFCRNVTPQDLADLVRNKDINGVAAKGIDPEWSEALIGGFNALAHLHTLEATWKPPAPIIKVQLKTKPLKQIPVSHLSDGQKHTILLTIAMLAESNLPLIIDQPEDDLDNEFISTAVVSTLRAIKQRRQVIVVTHNANIAVLGDSELILPLKRDGENGQVSGRGSIDRPETRQAVQQILEGGDLAFRKRMAIYGY